MKHSIAHDLGKDLARKAVLAAFASYQERFAKYHPTANWASDDRADLSFTAKGMTLKGSIEVLERSIEMDLDVPFVLRPFKGMALEKVETQVRKWIDKAKRGEI